MTRKIKNSYKLVIIITFFATLLIMAACKEKKESIPNTSLCQAGAKPPKIDTHGAIINIAARSNFNEGDPLEESNLFISECLFGKPEMAYPWFLSLIKNVLLT